MKRMKSLTLIVLVSAVTGCATTGTSEMSTKGKTMQACQRAFGDGRKFEQCSASAIDAEIVTACVQGFGDGQDSLNCIATAKDATVVKTCIQTKGTGSSGKGCINKSKM